MNRSRNRLLVFQLEPDILANLDEICPGLHGVFVDFAVFESSQN